jgi:acetyl esterase/lipase
MWAVAVLTPSPAFRHPHVGEPVGPLGRAPDRCAAFPPALITVGNADPLRPHSELLAEKLRAQQTEVETLVFPSDYQPPLGHEYQFDLDTDAGQLFLQRLLAFLRQRLAAPPQR